MIQTRTCPRTNPTHTKFTLFSPLFLLFLPTHLPTKKRIPALTKNWMEMSFFFFAVSVCENKAALARLYFFFRHIHRSPREGCGCACAKVCVRLSVCVCLLACSRQKKKWRAETRKICFPSPINEKSSPLLPLSLPLPCSTLCCTYAASCLLFYLCVLLSSFFLFALFFR